MTTKQENERSYTTMANWALILALLSWLILGIILAPTSLILAIKAGKSEDKATRMTATIAAIIGGISTLVMMMAIMIGLSALTYL